MLGKNIKRVANWLLDKICSHRIVHSQTVIDTIDHIWELLKQKGFSPRMMVDVGASRGEWTKLRLKNFENANVLMIDPLFENEVHLKKISLHQRRAQYWLGALGEQDGEMSLYAHGPQSSIYPSEWGGELRKVTVKTLDGLLAERGVTKIDVIKLDVQGAELEVLAGAKQALQECQLVQIEVSFRHVYKKAPLAHEIIVFFAERGFRIYDIAECYKRVDRALLQADVFFVKNDALFQPETWFL